MALKNIQLCHLDPEDKSKGIYTVTINGDRGTTAAVFTCSSLGAATALRNAIRDHADELRRVFDYSR